MKRPATVDQIPFNSGNVETVEFVVRFIPDGGDWTTDSVTIRAATWPVAVSRLRNFLVTKYGGYQKGTVRSWKKSST